MRNAVLPASSSLADRKEALSRVRRKPHLFEKQVRDSTCVMCLLLPAHVFIVLAAVINKREQESVLTEPRANSRVTEAAALYGEVCASVFPSRRGHCWPADSSFDCDVIFRDRF